MPLDAESLKLIFETWGPPGLAFYLLWQYWRSTPKTERPAPPKCGNDSMLNEMMVILTRIETMLEERRK